MDIAVADGWHVSVSPLWLVAAAAAFVALLVWNRLASR